MCVCVKDDGMCRSQSELYLSGVVSELVSALVHLVVSEKCVGEYPKIQCMYRYWYWFVVKYKYKVCVLLHPPRHKGAERGG